MCESEVKRGDLVQLEISGQNKRDHIIVTADDEGDAILPAAFEGLLERMMQSNVDVASDEGDLHLMVQLVRSPRGGAKRKLETTLECELIRKKKKHLYVVLNNSQLCFAVNLAHLTQPGLTNAEAFERGRELQHLAGLDPETLVTLADMRRFEEVVQRKIVVFHRDSEERALRLFDTAYPRCGDPLFMFLFQGHYYGIKNVKGLLGVNYVCGYCYRGYREIEKHTCMGYCILCHDSSCNINVSEAGVCTDCHRFYRSEACFLIHKSSAKGPSICSRTKKCPKCRLLYQCGEKHVCPKKSCNICGAELKVFRTNFLTAGTLAIPSPTNYRRQCKKFSRASIQWLEWEKATGKISHMERALNTGERKIGPYYVDGYAEIDGVGGVPFGELHAAGEYKMQRLKSVHSVRVTEMREHDWTEIMKTDPRVQHFLKDFHVPEPLEPRDALYGGRTCPFWLRYTQSPLESVHYVDFTSLYPFVNCYRQYPLGHPEIIRGDFKDPSEYFGLIRAQVFPPRGLYFPVLPFKTPCGKLVFTLCRTCAVENNQMSLCVHSDAERALTGVWVTVEFNKALTLRYRVGEITEV
ncbi:uncharacterized protein LOC142892509 [Nelusetta ayraudi]|uniref:uncharacterized protein LOC142892509 n=1 Tax=Nelusetta ayraudi TaxID=303726 RepID=UPI003F6FF1BA